MGVHSESGLCPFRVLDKGGSGGQGLESEWSEGRLEGEMRNRMGDDKIQLHNAWLHDP